MMHFVVLYVCNYKVNRFVLFYYFIYTYSCAEVDLLSHSFTANSCQKSTENIQDCVVHG